MADERLDQFEPVSLEELDERASLLRRVDNKYAVDRERFAQLLERLREDHQVLEIEGRRQFAYCTTYFDTRRLRCFVDHVEDRRPRFKARTRLYEDTGYCVFEVKLKHEDGETDKRQIDHAVKDAERFTEGARECLAQALGSIELQAPEEMAPTLSTSFHRITLAAREGSEHRLLAELGLEPISLSKYRVGMGLVGGADDAPQPGSELFERRG